MNEEEVKLALSIECPVCGRQPNDMCRNSMGYKMRQPHWKRLWKAEEV